MDAQKFRTLEDSINGVKDSCSKDISKIRTMLQEVAGKLATLEPQTKIPTMDVRRHRHDTDAIGDSGPGHQHSVTNLRQWNWGGSVERILRRGFFKQNAILNSIALRKITNYPKPHFTLTVKHWSGTDGFFGTNN